ncbi:family 16 glycosylhydrolase, partial [Streptococcus pneumoniae]|nr:family 16 glycosylhydrolase [Streptococcus pneumoniae]
HGKVEFLYGKLEMRAKLPKGQGVFPAFWTLGSDFTLDGKINPVQGRGWPSTGEIDIMELVGERNSNGSGNKTVYQTLHYGQSDNDDG